MVVSPVSVCGCSLSFVSPNIGGYYNGVMKYRTTMNIIHRRLVTTSLSVTWHLNSMLARSVVRGR